MEAKPIGAVTIRTRTVRKQPRRQRFVKVSHHGGNRQRWRPLSLHWWEKNVGPIPDGYQVFHIDGNSLNDDPQNLVLKRENYWQLIFAARPEAVARQAKRRSRAVAKSNRNRAMIRNAWVRTRCWYIALPRTKAFVWIPCETAREASALMTPKEIAILCQTNLLRLAEHRCPMFQPGDSIEVVRGRQIIAGSRVDGRFDGYVRLIHDKRQPPRKRKTQAISLNLEPAANGE